MSCVCGRVVQYFTKIDRNMSDIWVNSKRRCKLLQPAQATDPCSNFSSFASNYTAQPLFLTKIPSETCNNQPASKN